jgi:hypothetical protein
LMLAMQIIERRNRNAATRRRCLDMVSYTTELVIAYYGTTAGGPHAPRSERRWCAGLEFAHAIPPASNTDRILEHRAVNSLASGGDW